MPSVRPIGGKPILAENGLVEHNNQLYFYTDNRKPVYKQMTDNASVAVAFIVADGSIRLMAKAVFDDNVEVKRMMISEKNIIGVL